MTEKEGDKVRINHYFKKTFNVKDEFYINEFLWDPNKDKELENSLSRHIYDMLKEEDTERKDLNHISYQIHYDINTKFALSTRRKFVKPLNFSMKMAGVIILAMTVFLRTKSYFTRYSRHQSWIEFKAPAWSRAKFSPPDGTIGWLNSKSTLRYCGNFRDQRMVSVSGEVLLM